VLPCFVQFPMLTWIVVGRIQDGFFEKEIAHPVVVSILEMRSIVIGIYCVKNESDIADYALTLNILK
jgi:hypothetical protein